MLLFGTAQGELEGIVLSERNQLEEDKYHMLSLICGISLKKKTLNNSDNRLVVVRGGGNGGGDQ